VLIQLFQRVLTRVEVLGLAIVLVRGVADAWDSWYTRAQWIVHCIVHADLF